LVLKYVRFISQDGCVHAQIGYTNIQTNQQTMNRYNMLKPDVVAQESEITTLYTACHTGL